MKRVLITTGVVAVAGGLVTAFVVSSCGPDCEESDQPSVIVQIVDDGASTDAVKFAQADKVNYEWTDPDSGEVTRGEAECANEDCSEWTLGVGRPGTYKVTAEVCGKDYQQTVDLDLNEGGCTVDAELMDIAVSTADCAQERSPAKPQELQFCSLEQQPSVIAYVEAEVDGKMVPIGASKVYYNWAAEPNGRELPGTCLNRECSQFAAGLEQEGRFEVGAEVCGEVYRKTVEVNQTDDRCHVDTQAVRLIADASKCKQLPEPKDVLPKDVACTLEAVPSAMLFPITQEGDVVRPHATEQLWFEQGGTRHKGFCAKPRDDGKCEWWVAGWELSGRFKAYTETCETESSVAFNVELSQDGCHVVTEYVPVMVDTRGCIRAPGPEDQPTPSVPTDVAR